MKERKNQKKMTAFLYRTLSQIMKTVNTFFAVCYDLNKVLISYMYSMVRKVHMTIKIYIYLYRVHFKYLLYYFSGR